MIRTAECVTPKHPDKMCDRISDAILDECLRQDPESRTAIEVMGGHGQIVIMGELATKAKFGAAFLNEVVTRIVGHSGMTIQNNLVKQSPFISKGVESGGAGDQGIMVGYACTETPELMPREVMLARSLCQFIYSYYPYDGKTQVTLNDQTIITIVASFQNVDRGTLFSVVELWLYNNKLENSNEAIKVLVNPAGDWSQGGFDADTGLTGRKIVVDNYGPRIPIGGGAFSGKDGTKVDRSAAYMARLIAVDYLYSHRAKEVFVYLSYAIGKSMPMQGTAIVDGKEISLLHSTYNLTPNAIIDFLKLKTPGFEKTAEWGHCGNYFPWDKAIKTYARNS